MLENFSKKFKFIKDRFYVSTCSVQDNSNKDNNPNSSPICYPDIPTYDEKIDLNKKVTNTLVDIDYSIKLPTYHIYVRVAKDKFESFKDKSKTLTAELSKGGIYNLSFYKKSINSGLKKIDNKTFNNENLDSCKMYLLFDLFFDVSLTRKNQILSTKKNYIPIMPQEYNNNLINKITLDDLKLNIDFKNIHLNPVQETPTFYIYRVKCDISITLLPLVKINPLNTSTLSQFNKILNKNLDNNIFLQSELLSIEELNYNETIFFTSDFFKYLKNLKRLSIIKCDYLYIEDDLSSLINLEEIDLSNNQLTLVPRPLENLENLKVIKLKNNKISNLSMFKDKDISIYCTAQNITYNVFKKYDNRYEVDTSFLCDQYNNNPSIINISDSGYTKSVDGKTIVVFDIEYFDKNVSFQFTNHKNFSGKVYIKLT